LAYRDDYDNPDAKRRELLLILHPAVRGQKNIKGAFGTSQEIAVPERAPTFLLNGADFEFRKLPP
jgi:hypothetical protein